MRIGIHINLILIILMIDLSSVSMNAAPTFNGYDSIPYKKLFCAFEIGEIPKRSTFLAMYFPLQSQVHSYLRVSIGRTMYSKKQFLFNAAFSILKYNVLSTQTEKNLSKINDSTEYLYTSVSNSFTWHFAIATELSFLIRHKISKKVSVYGGISGLLSFPVIEHYKFSLKMDTIKIYNNSTYYQPQGPQTVKQTEEWQKPIRYQLSH